MIFLNVIIKNNKNQQIRVKIMDAYFYDVLDSLYESDPRRIEPFLLESIAEGESGGDQALVIAAANELGGFYRGQGRYAESAQRFRQAMDTLEAIGLGGGREYLTALLNRAGTYRLDRRAEKAAEDFLRVLQLLDGVEGDTFYIRASATNNLALAYQELGRFDEAETYARSAMEMIEPLPGMEAEKASSRNNLAGICIMRRDFAAAEGWLKEAEDYYTSPDGDADPHKAAYFSALAVVQHALGRPEEAMASYAVAAEVSRRFFGKGRDYAGIRRGMATVARSMGRADAEELMREAAEVYAALPNGEAAAEDCRAALKAWEDRA